MGEEEVLEGGNRDWRRGVGRVWLDVWLGGGRVCSALLWLWCGNGRRLGSSSENSVVV